MSSAAVSGGGADSLAAARALARQWAALGTTDVHATDPDGIPLPSYVIGEAIAAAEIEFIRSGEAPRDLVTALVVLLGPIRDKALLVGFCRALQRALEKGST